MVVVVVEENNRNVVVVVVKEEENNTELVVVVVGGGGWGRGKAMAIRRSKNNGRKKLKIFFVVWKRTSVPSSSLSVHDVRAGNQWTGIRTMTAAENRICKITLRLLDFKSQTS